MSSTRPRPVAPPLCLVATLDGRRCTFPLGHGRNLIGSLSSCEVFLDHPGISRQHARIEVRQRSATLEDLESKNGTELNGRAIRSTELQLGDAITLCGLTLTVEGLSPEEGRLGLALSEDGPRRPELLSRTTQLHRDALDLQQGVVDCVDWLDDLWGRLFQSPDPDIETCLRRLVEAVGGDGGALVEARGDEVVLSASCGAIASHRWGDASAIDADATSSTVWQSLDGSRCLGLVLCGAPPSPLCDRLAALVLRWWVHGRQPHMVAMAGGVEVQDHRRRLVFPPGYVRGESRAMAAVHAQLRHLTQGDVPVLIIGDTGVGKELLARSLHLSSERRKGPMVTINCAAIPEDLLEAELFGIARGVATGVQGRSGRIAQADGGTLFLDEIGDMPPSLQAKLLRVLQEKEVQPLGGSPTPVDVRIVSATHNELSTMIERGTFRRDLYYRLAGYVLRLPSLAERIDDLPLLVEHFLKRFSQDIDKPIRGVTVGALRLMAEYPWPGNVRQLEHEVRRLAYLAYPGQAVDSSLLSPEIRQPTASQAQVSSGQVPSAQARSATEEGVEGEEVVSTLPTLDLGRLEAMAITAALAEANGVLTEAGRRLGISRDALRRRLQRHGLR